MMKVCIIGSGLSSLTLANALVNEGIYVDIFFSEQKQKQDKSRTISISKSNVEYFCKHITDIKKIIWNIKNIEIFSENLKDIKLLNFEKNNEQLFSIVENYKLFEILLKNLDKNKYVKKFQKRINQNIQNNYELIINTEYSNSLTKKYFHNKIKKKYNSLAYASVIKHKKKTNTFARQIFTRKGPLAFLPVSNNKTSIVYSIKQSQKIDQKALIKLLNNYNSFYEIDHIDKFKSFNLISINLRNYFYKNILAFGDLIHRIHPLAGQGFNMTIRDIKQLIEIIKSRRELGLNLDISVCKQFEQKTKSKNIIFSNGIDLIYEFFNLENKTNNKVLSQSLQLIGKNQSINKMFIKFADNGLIY